MRGLARAEQRSVSVRSAARSSWRIRIRVVVAERPAQLAQLRRRVRRPFPRQRRVEDHRLVDLVDRDQDRRGAEAGHEGHPAEHVRAVVDTGRDPLQQPGPADSDSASSIAVVLGALVSSCGSCSSSCTQWSLTSAASVRSSHGLTLSSVASRAEPEVGPSQSSGRAR